MGTGTELDELIKEQEADAGQKTVKPQVFDSKTGGPHSEINPKSLALLQQLSPQLRQDPSDIPLHEQKFFPELIKKAIAKIDYYPARERIAATLHPDGIFLPVKEAMKLTGASQTTIRGDRVRWTRALMSAAEEMGVAEPGFGTMLDMLYPRDDGQSRTR